jgi:hypothetical protein
VVSDFRGLGPKVGHRGLKTKGSSDLNSSLFMIKIASNKRDEPITSISFKMVLNKYLVAGKGP